LTFIPDGAGDDRVVDQLIGRRREREVLEEEKKSKI